MLVGRRSGFRLGGRNDGLGMMGAGHRGVPPPVRSLFESLRTNGRGRPIICNQEWDREIPASAGITGWGQRPFESVQGRPFDFPPGERASLAARLFDTSQGRDFRFLGFARNDSWPLQ